MDVVRLLFVENSQFGGRRKDRQRAGKRRCRGESGVNLGHRFPNGLLVVQDGQNTGAPRESTNFKFVRWDDVAHAIR
jgi:hypothetical protein